ncbi:MAG TPA: SDR family oxidoreductase [Limnobacter sp.]|nr:SDR family oxidoreductase [Limnobacter sp.]
MTQWALITGASSGIGLHLAELFAKDKINLVLSARSTDKLHALANSLKQQHGVQVHVVASDLSQPGAADALVQAIEAHGVVLSHVVNNAGVGVFGLFKDNALAEELAMMQLNMQSLVVLCKRLLPQLLQTRGQIMNVASTAAFQPGPYMAVYYATKAFVLSFSEALDEELTGTGVNVTALCPGPTASGFQAQANMNKSALVQGRKLPTSEEVAAEAYAAYKARRRVTITGWMNWVMAQSVRFTPRKVITKVVKTISKPA